MRGRLTIFAAVALVVLTAGCLEEIGGEGDAGSQDPSGVENATQEQAEEGGWDGTRANGGDTATPLVDDGQYLPPGSGEDESSATAPWDTRSVEDQNDEQDEESSSEDTQNASSESEGDPEATDAGESEGDGSSGDDGSDTDPDDEADGGDGSSEDEEDDESDEEDPDAEEGDGNTTDSDEGLIGDVIRSIDMESETTSPGSDGESSDDEGESGGTLVMVGANLGD